MGKIDREWHLTHKMPKNASKDERIAWLLAHARNCGCRKIEGKLAELLRRPIAIRRTARPMVRDDSAASCRRGDEVTESRSAAPTVI
jgi:hypothetical protein